MIEQWKPIDEFPLYSVSNYGRIRNNATEKILLGGYDKDGYRQVTLSYNGKQYNRRICRLVAIAFIPNPENLPQVNHKDENKKNDYAYNLEWCTAQYNNNYGHRVSKTRRKVQCVETGHIYDGVRVVEKETGIAHSNISYACRTGNMICGLHWKHVD